MDANGATILDRQPPCDLEAEKAVLGSAVLDQRTLDHVATRIGEADFYDDAHGQMFRVFWTMHSRGRTLDARTIVDALRRENLLEQVGGVPYLSKVIGSVPNAAHAVHYADIVRRMAERRRLIAAAQDIMQMGYDDTAPEDDTNDGEVSLAASAESRIMEVAEANGSLMDGLREPAGTDGWVHDALDRLEARMRGESGALGVPYGYCDLDNRTGGMRGGELIVLGGRPGHGKSSLAMGVLSNLMNEERPADEPGSTPCRQAGRWSVILASLEMSAVEMADRMLSMRARVNLHRMRNATIGQDERTRLVEQASAMSQSNLFIEDSGALTVSQLAAVCRRQSRRREGLDLIVIDYLQLLTPEAKRNANREQEVAKMTRRLKGLARQLDVPILCLSQLNRESVSGAGQQPRAPRLSDLRESGAIEQDADVVLFVHRPEMYYTPGSEEAEAFTGQGQVICAKQRNGPTGTAEMVFLSQFARWEDRAPERLQGADPGQHGGEQQQDFF